MLLKEAIEKAEKDEDVRKLGDFYLGSGFSATVDGKVDEWTLLFFNPDSKKTIDCFVNDRFVTVGEEMPAMNEIAELKPGEFKLTAEDAFRVAKKKFDDKPTTAMLSAHTSGGRATWTVTMIAPNMVATAYDIDAKSGSVTKEKSASLIQKPDTGDVKGSGK